MKIDFPSHISIDNSPENILISYRHMMDCHLNLLKQQSNCEFFFWKIAGVFSVVTFTALIMQDKGLISNAFTLILFAGIGCLLAFAQNTKKDLKYGASAVKCVKKGIIIEKTQNFTEHIFQIFEDNQSHFYRRTLLSRIFIFWLIGILTTVAGIILAIKIGPWLAISAALFSFIFLFLISHFYAKLLRKALLG